MKPHHYRGKVKRSALALALLFATTKFVLATETTNELAKVGDYTITEADIADEIAGPMVRLNNQLYSVKKHAVDTAIANYLIDQEAKKRGVTRAQLIKEEITDKAPKVTDAEIQKIYDANKSRLGGKKLEDIKPQILQQLQKNKQQEQEEAFVKELRKAVTVQMFLKPPILSVDTDGAPVRGAENAPITIVEFSDFQ